MDDMDYVALSHLELEAVSSGNSTASKAAGSVEVPNYWAVLLLLGRNSDDNLLPFMVAVVMAEIRYLNLKHINCLANNCLL